MRRVRRGGVKRRMSRGGISRGRSVRSSRGRSVRSSRRGFQTGYGVAGNTMGRRARVANQPGTRRPSVNRFQTSGRSVSYGNLLDVTGNADVTRRYTKTKRISKNFAG